MQQHSPCQGSQSALDAPEGQLCAARLSPLEALPPELLAAIANLLGPGPSMRLCLSACSHSLLAASQLQDHTWWRELHIRSCSATRARAGAILQGFRDWLASCQPPIHRLEITPMWFGRCPLPLKTPVRELASLHLANMEVSEAELLSVAAHTQLTQLTLAECEVWQVPTQVSRLERLQNLSLECTAVPAGLGHFCGLSLTSLTLRSPPEVWFGFDYSRETDLPEEASRLTALASLQLGHLHGPCGGLRHVPASLTSLAVRNCGGFKALPAAFSRLTLLQSLDLEGCDSLAGGWDHLAGLPLTSLYLQHAGCAELPAVVGTLSALRHLRAVQQRSLDDAPLRRLSRLGQLTCLELGISPCPLPEVMSRLTALSSLDFIVDAPATSTLAVVASLTQLTDLSAGFESMPAVDAAFASLTRLRRLALWSVRDGTNLSGGWQHLSALQHLTSLQVDGSRHGSVPAQLASLAALHELVLTCCDWLGSGWQHLACLTQLADLYCTLCTSLGQEEGSAAPCLPALQQLWLQDCQLIGPDGGAAVLPNITAPGLTRLYIGSCDPLQLPCMEAMPRLTDLSVRSKQLAVEEDCVSTGGGHFSSLRQLTRLELTYCGLQGLPAQVGSCPGLRSLHLDGNRTLGDSPGSFRHLARLSFLTHLSLGECGLLSVPAALSCLTALQALSLVDNPDCRNGWEALLALPHLASLHAFTREGRELPTSLIAKPGLDLVY